MLSSIAIFSRPQSPQGSYRLLTLYPYLEPVEPLSLRRGQFEGVVVPAARFQLLPNLELAGELRMGEPCGLIYKQPRVDKSERYVTRDPATARWCCVVTCMLCSYETRSEKRETLGGYNGRQDRNMTSSSSANSAAFLCPGQDEPYTNGHPTSNAFPTSSGASGVWTQPNGPWNNAESNAAIRRTSSSPSPARQRDGISDLSNGLPAGPSLFAIGQTGAYSNSRSKAANGAIPDANSSTFRYTSPLRDSVGEDSTDANGIASSLSTLGFDSEALPPRTRAAHGSANVYSTASAAASVAGSTASTSAAPGTANGSGNANGGTSGLPSFGSFGPISTSNQGHSHRTSLQASTSYSSPAAPTHALPYHRNSQPEDANTLAMAQMFRQSQALDERAADSAMNAVGSNFGASMAAYSQAQAQASFQFNPISESWDAGVRAHGFDAYAQGRESATAAAFSAARGHFGSADRGNTPIGGPFQQVSSPRSLGTPTNTTGPWSRPQSRDPRASGLSDSNTNGANSLLQRQPLQNFLHEQQLSAAAAASFNGNPNFLPNNLGSYPLFNTFRAPLQMSPLGMQIGAPMGNPLLPNPHMQPSRDRDLVRSLRSPVLDDFRTSRTNRRFELKVCCFMGLLFSCGTTGPVWERLY